MSRYMTDEEIAAEQTRLYVPPVEPEYGPDVDEVATDKHDVSPADLLSPDNYTSKVVRDERYATCKGCPRLFKATRTCKECGCFMAAKTWLTEASCPLGKW